MQVLASQYNLHLAQNKLILYLKKKSFQDLTYGIFYRNDPECFTLFTLN